MGWTRKTFLLLLMVGAGYVYVEHVNPGIVVEVFTWLQINYPAAAKAVEAGIQHAQKGTLVGVSLVMFASRLPFMPFPPEPYILFAAGNTTVFPLAGTAAFFGTAGATVSYTVGRILGHHGLKDSWMAHRIQNLQDSFLLPLSIFAAAALPVPDVSSFLFGTVKTPFKTFVVYSFLGFLFWVAALVLLVQHVQVVHVPGVDMAVNLSVNGFRGSLF